MCALQSDCGTTTAVFCRFSFFSFFSSFASYFVSCCSDAFFFCHLNFFYETSYHMIRAFVFFHFCFSKVFYLLFMQLFRVVPLDSGTTIEMFFCSFQLCRVVPLESGTTIEMLFCSLFFFARVGFGSTTGLLSPGNRQLSEKVMADVDQEVQVKAKTKRGVCVYGTKRGVFCVYEMK